MKRTKIHASCGAALLILFSMLCQTITASAAPDTQSPTAPKELTVINRTHTAISLSWTSSSDDIKVKGYQIFRNGKKIINTTKVTYTNTDLVPGQQYTYYIKAYDAAGNVSAGSIALSTTTISDSLRPSAPGGLAATASTFTSISLTWESSTDNVAIKGYEVYCNEKKVASTSGTYYECKKLIPGTNYSFCIKAYDKAGNYSAESNHVSANTISDKTAPSPPRGLTTSSVTVTEVNLTWTPSLDNVKVKGYDVLRDGIKIGTTSKTSYLNKSLIPGKSYTYTVRASDISGNLSGNSSQLKVTTPKDLQAPAAPAELKVAAVNGSSVSLKWSTSTDNAKVAGYQIYCNGIIISNAVRTSRIVKSPFGIGLDVYWVKAYDQAGNLSSSSNTVTAITFPR